MTIWVNNDIDLIDVVLEPRRPGVVTFLATNVDQLLPYAALAPEPPFPASGGLFTVGIHVPIRTLQACKLGKYASPEFAEHADLDVSPAPQMYKWIGWRQVEMQGEDFEEEDDFDDGICYQQGFGYVWPDDPHQIADALAVDGWEDVALVPCYQEFIGLESTGQIAGVFDSFIICSDEEGEDPPSLRDRLGGDA